MARHLAALMVVVMVFSCGGQRGAAVSQTISQSGVVVTGDSFIRLAEILSDEINTRTDLPNRIAVGTIVVRVNGDDIPTGVLTNEIASRISAKSNGTAVTTAVLNGAWTHVADTDDGRGNLARQFQVAMRIDGLERPVFLANHYLVLTFQRKRSGF